jgi:hypothetical protein
MRTELIQRKGEKHLRDQLFAFLTGLKCVNGRGSSVGPVTVYVVAVRYLGRTLGVL